MKTRKDYAIGILGLSAVLMATALLVSPTNAGPVGSVVNTDRGDYSIATAKIQTGGDAIYVLEKRRGLLLVATIDLNSGWRVRAVDAVSTAFTPTTPAPGAPNAAPANPPRR